MSMLPAGRFAVGLALIVVGLLGLLVLRKARPKSLQTAEALLKGRPVAHGAAAFLVLLGLVLIVAALA